MKLVLVPSRVRRPARVVLPPSAYVDMSGLSVPESVADLEVVPGWCHSAQTVVQCSQAAPGSVCVDCAMVELGERLELFNQRTNAGIPKAKFYRDLERAQCRPDEDYKRLMAWKAKRDKT